MGHISHEPSMEEILSSIKRIIAEDDGPATRGRKSQAKPVKLVTEQDTDEAATGEAEVLELTDAVAQAGESRDADSPPVAVALAPVPSTPASPIVEDEIVSTTAAAASRNALASLARMTVRNEDQVPENSLEGLVRDMLRPMLKEWLDANLPAVVETLVAKEIARISGNAL